MEIPLPVPWARWIAVAAVLIAAAVALAVAVLGPVAGVISGVFGLVQAGVAMRRGRRLVLTPTHVTRIGPMRTDRWSWDARGLPDHPAVAIYRDAPHRRAAIGTPEEHERLMAELRERGT